MIKGIPPDAFMKALHIFRFGSHVYGSNDEQSDNDYILVFDEPRMSPNTNLHYYSFDEFKRLLDNCDIQMLECIFLPEEHILKQRNRFKFELDKQKLRKSISTISSNSWVKGKKKLTIMGDYHLRTGLKSIYHSLRILDYGIQICKFDKIVYWDRMNFILHDMKKMSGFYSTIDLWDRIDNKYRGTFNRLSTEFKILAPKDTRDSVKRREIEELLTKYGVSNNDLLTELTAIL